MLAIHTLSYSRGDAAPRKDFSRKSLAIRQDVTIMTDSCPETVNKKKTKASQPAYARCPNLHSFGAATKRRRVFVWEDSTCPHRRISRSTPPPPHCGQDGCTHRNQTRPNPPAHQKRCPGGRERQDHPGGLLCVAERPACRKTVTAHSPT